MNARAAAVLAAVLAAVYAALHGLVPSVALAHPGHGTTEPETWSHYFTEPLHLAAIATATLVTVPFVIGLRRTRPRPPE